MWRNGFDIQALTDMINISIEVTLFDPKTNLVENVQTFVPSPNFPWKENYSMKPNIHKYKRNMIKLLNYKNQHFNLIVGEDDEIVNMLVPKKKVSQTVNDKNPQNEDSHALKDLTNRLKLSEDSNKELAQKLKFSEESKTKMKRDHKEAL